MMNLESHIMEKVEVVRSRGRDTKGERAGPGLSLTLNIDICMNKEVSGDGGGSECTMGDIRAHE